MIGTSLATYTLLQSRHLWDSGIFMFDVWFFCVVVFPEFALVRSSIRLYIGVHSLCSETSYTICVAAVDSSLQVDRDSVGTKDPAFDLPGEFARCANCEKYVPSQSMQRHEAFCVRHNVRCTHHGCGKLLRRTEADQHTHCKRCGLAITNQADALQKHIQ
eukprot:Rmarinus@m.2108